MQKVKIIIVGFILFCIVFAISSETYAWTGNASILVANISGRRTMPNGLFMYIVLITSDPLQAANVKSVRAWNQDPNIDPNTYVLSFPYKEVRKTGTDYQFVIETPYIGQYGVYNIEITYQDDSTEIIQTLPINPWNNPYPVPSGLEVDFSTGVSSPTFRFMPIDSPDIDYYMVRVRQYERTGTQVIQARRVFRTIPITSWTPGQPIEVILPQLSDGSGTGEPLLPGVEYEVRVEAYDQNGANTPPTWQSSFRSEIRTYFRIPATSILYDNFSGAFIDKNKWKWEEWVREIDTRLQKLVMKQSVPSPITISSYPYRNSNWLNFSDPNSLNTIQADIAIVQTNLVNQGNVRARIGGRWYNDGTPGDGMTGDIWASVELRAGPGGLTAICGVSKMTNADGTSWVDIAWRTFTTVPALNTPYTLFISYDGTNNFIFRIGSETVVLGPPDGLPTRASGAKMPFKGIGTRVQIDNGDSSVFISATFDNVYKNGVLYDDFSSSTIDSVKWTNYEFVREISEGKLRSKTRSSSASASFINNELAFVNPSLINNFKTKVTLFDYQNPQGLLQLAGISGAFYNDGTPGGGRIGDVVAEVLIGGRGTSPSAYWRVYKYTNAEGTTGIDLASGSFSSPVNLGNTYILSLGWNGTTFTFKFGSEVATYTPTTSINPVNVSFKRLRTIIYPEVDKKEATIEALFDDVIINLPPKNIVDFDGDAKTDITIYRAGMGAWFVYPSGGMPPYGIGWGGDLSDQPVPGDYDGDGKTDIAIYRGINGGWYIIPSSNPGAPYGLGWGGLDSDKPVPGDYDGDGKTDIAIYRGINGGWYIIPSSNPGAPYGLGWGGDLTDKPAPGDYDGDGKTDIAVYRTNTGAWYVFPSGGGAPYGLGWGGDLTDKPVPGDYDGDGKTDIAVYRTSIGAWYVKPSGGGTPYGFGWGGDDSDKPVPGDYDGDGKTDYAVYRSGTGAWYIYPSGGGAPYGLGWGGDPTDIPVTMNLSGLE